MEILISKKFFAGIYINGVMIALATPTETTIGSIAYNNTFTGIPITETKIDTKTPPLTTVAKNPANAGFKSNFFILSSGNT